MNRSFRPIFFAFAVAIGAVAFSFLWLPKASAAAAKTCSATPATMCINGKTVYDVPVATQSSALANTKVPASCGACKVSN